MTLTTGTATSVLIVEDERIVASDLQQTLADMGYDSSALASSADEALARASEKVPDVVLMDIRIKGQRDGIETATLLRERYGVPVVYLTAHADDATIDRAKLSEPYGYLVKPVKAAELRSAIEVSVFKHAMEKRQRARERLFVTTLRSIDEAVIAVDLAGRISFMNPTAESLTGVKSSDALGRRARDVLHLTNASGERPPETPFDRALRELTPIRSSEAQLGAPDGGSTARPISDSTAPVIENDELLGAVMVFRDITEQTRSDLTDRLESLGTLAAGVAHEINNPLAVVVGNASFVLEEVLRVQEGQAAGGEVARSLEGVIQAQSDLQSAASRIASIVADLSSFMRPVTRTSDETDVRRAIQRAIRATAEEFRDRAVVEAAIGDTPTADMEESRLVQVLVNLLLNAAHAITPGHLEENRVTVKAMTGAQGSIVIEVHDTGSGMTPETLRRIFDPFFTTRDVGAGAGLGLSICYGIVHSAGGEIRAESSPGNGSTLHLMLPPAAERTAPPREPVQQAHTRRARILVVDDDDLVLRATKRVLRNHDVVCTESARSALEFIDSGGHFDLILSDVMMPVMGGVEFYEALLQRNHDLARRVVFVTGGATTARVADFLDAVPNTRILKPFGVQDLQETVRLLLATFADAGSDERKPR